MDAQQSLSWSSQARIPHPTVYGLLAGRERGGSGHALESDGDPVGSAPFDDLTARIAHGAESFCRKRALLKLEKMRQCGAVPVALWMRTLPSDIPSVSEVKGPEVGRSESAVGEAGCNIQFPLWEMG